MPRDNIPIYGGSPGKGHAGNPPKHGGPKKGGPKKGGPKKTPYDPYKSQIKKQNQQDSKTNKNFLSQAKILGSQADALKYALDKDKGFGKALKIKLANIAQDLAQQDSLLMEGYRKRMRSLRGASNDNDKASDDQSYANLSNRARERANATSQALSQGAGESDLLRSEQMSLRSWDANQGEINRGYYDTLRSINSSLTDLNVDTKTGRSNLYLQANEDRESVTNNYYSQMAETWTQLGNVYGQAANNQGQAAVYGKTGDSKDKKDKKDKKGGKEKIGGGIGKDWVKPPKTGGGVGKDWEKPGSGGAGQVKDWGTVAPGVNAGHTGDNKDLPGIKDVKNPNMKQNENLAGKAFMNAAKFSGMSYKDPGIPDKIMGWTGEGRMGSKLTNSVYLQNDAEPERKKPEGAKLRSWT